MKKVLLASAALLVAGMVSANAAPVKLSVGGYARWYTGYVDSNNEYEDFMKAETDGYNHVPVVGDVEVQFKGETALQNGVKVGAVIELTGVSNEGTDEDQSYIYVDSSVGRFTAGKMDSVSKQLHKSAKDVGLLGTQMSDVDMFQVISAGSTDIRYNDDAATIAYFSPKFAGFTVAASYSDMGYDATHNFEGNAAMYLGTLAYDNTFGSVRLSADVSYAAIDSDMLDDYLDLYYGYDNVLSAGVRVSVSGFTFGAGYKYEDGKGLNGDVNTFDVGVAYENGPYGVSLSYMNRDDKGGYYSSDKQEMYLGSASYDITDGVKTFASVAYMKDSGDGAKYETYLFATGLGLTF